jgi:hypothetical protein
MCSGYVFVGEYNFIELSEEVNCTQFYGN